jgi:hypothetical protein
VRQFLDTRVTHLRESPSAIAGIERAPRPLARAKVMSFDPLPRRAAGPVSEPPDERPTLPAPPASSRRASGLRRKAPATSPLDPLEEALLSRPIWDSREPEPAVHEILYRLSVGDEAGAIAAGEILLDGRRAPALTVTYDVLDELELDQRAALVLAKVDGTTPLSRVLRDCGLDRATALRTLCDLVERRIVVLRHV